MIPIGTNLLYIIFVILQGKYWSICLKKYFFAIFLTTKKKKWYNLSVLFFNLFYMVRENSRSQEYLSNEKELQKQMKELEKFFQNMKNPEFRKNFIESQEKDLHDWEKTLKESQKTFLESGIFVKDSADLKVQMEFFGLSEGKMQKLLQQFSEKWKNSLLVLREKNGELFLEKTTKNSKNIDDNISILGHISFTHAISELQGTYKTFQKVKSFEWELSDEEIQNFMQKLKKEISQKMKK